MHFPQPDNILKSLFVLRKLSNIIFLPLTKSDLSQIIIILLLLVTVMSKVFALKTFISLINKQILKFMAPHIFSTQRRKVRKDYLVFRCLLSFIRFLFYTTIYFFDCGFGIFFFASLASLR